MKIQMLETRWVTPMGVRLCRFKRGEIYEVSRYCGSFLIAKGYAQER